MGKKGRKRTFKGRKGKGGGGKGTDEWHSSRGKTVVKENAQFEAFYKHQKVVPEDEWDAFLTSLKTSLPSCFRVPNGRYADQVRTTLATDTFGLDGLELKSKKELFEGNEYTAQPPAPVDWLPEGYAWVFNIPRPLIRKSPQLKAFHQWMIQENASGNINRQEAVSMIPPLLLDVQCGHSVLDMCAAPGSKTAQIVDALHEEGKLNSGLCVANDADNKRAFLLTHQLKRFGGDSLLVSNHQGQRFPKLRPRPKDREAKGESGMEFDRVLCDVPCCGDGTVRKAPEMWKKWNYGMGPGLHKLQLAILIRGLELLKPGGRLVYSTCTMNPYENEAVVAEAVRRFGGKVTLIDTTSDLPNLRRQPGLLTWGVRDTKAETERWYASPSEVPDGGQKSKLTATLWPPPTEAEARALGLQHCLRLLPHYHDTGAFFVCAMVKVEATLPGHDYALGREDEPEKQATTERNPHTSVGFTHGGQAGSAAAAAQEARDERQAAAEPAAAAAPAAAEAAAASSEPRVVTETVVDGTGVASATVRLVTPRPPDWICLHCRRNNYANRTECFKCHTPKGGDKPPVGKSGKRRGQQQPEEDRYELIPSEQWASDPKLLSIKQFYGLGDDFPYDCVVRRGSETSAKLFIVSHASRRMLAMDGGQQLRLISAGAKIFVYSRKTNTRDQDAITTDFRLCQETSAMIRPLLGPARLITLNLTDVAKIVGDKIRDRRTDILPEHFTTGPEALAALRQLAPGSFIVQLGEADGSVAEHPMCVCCWRGKGNEDAGSINLFVTKEELVSVRAELEARGATVGEPTASPAAASPAVAAAGGEDEGEEPAGKKRKTDGAEGEGDPMVE